MNRSPSALAQLSFSACHRLQFPGKASPLTRLFSRFAGKFIYPLARELGRNHTITVHLYGHDLRMPAEHFLPATLKTYPTFNRPLGLTVEAISKVNRGNISVIDVGANIGDSAASIEHRCPTRCSFLCVEPDGDLAELCRINHRNNPRVKVERRYIGENEDAFVALKNDDGRGNPATIAGDSGERLVRLDALASSFVKENGLDLLKVDTEGYDFSVLRSASTLLSQHKPTVYFEWSPVLLKNLGEDVFSAFNYLSGFGYRHFVFFTSTGKFYCNASVPSPLFLRGLLGVTGKDMEYFDICATSDEALCERLTDLSTQ